MSPVSLARWHGLVLLALLVIPKALKVRWLVPGATQIQMLKLMVADLVFVVLAELLVWAVGRAAGARAGRWVRAAWGLALLPLMVFVVSEHRFFLATGSFLDGSMFWFGVTSLGQLGGAIKAELTPLSALFLALPLPLALLFGFLGWRVQAPPGVSRRVGAVAAVVAMAGLLLMFWHGGSIRNDPRLGALQGSALINLGRRAVLQYQAERRAAEKDLSHLIPPPVELESTPESQLDNVVVILLESFRANATSVHTPSLETTPFLARMAREGLKVERGYSTLPHTTKCLVASLCGLPPDIRWPLSEVIPGTIPVACLPQLLKPLGYQSAFIMPASRSFENNGSLINNMGFDRGIFLEDLDRKKWQSPNYLGLEDRSMTEPIMRWIDARQGRPFFLTALTLTSHHDYKVPTNFPVRTYPGSERWNDYLNSIRYVDTWMSELFQAFDQRGLLDRTTFVFIGDHGEGHGEHGRKGHDEILYEEGLHVPFVVWSRHLVPEPKTITGLRQNIDIVPTVIELMRLKIAQGSFMGRSLLSSAEGRVIFGSCWYEDRCIARWWDDMKLIYFYRLRPPELYDLARDPDERQNLYATLQKQTADRYVNEMLAWKQSVRDLYTAQKQRSARGRVFLDRPDPSRPLDIVFEKKLNLVGYDLPPVEPGKVTTVTLYFSPQKNIPWGWKVQFALQGPGGKEWPLKVSGINPAHPMGSWVPGQFFKIGYTLEIPGGVRPGQGHLWVSIVGSKGVKRKVRGAGADPKREQVDLPLMIR